ncbi:MAG: metallophosphoesterase [Chlamydiota bacterium]|jgi:predicted phosphohydrolase
MKVFAIADLHLNLSVPDKSMEIFGPVWESYVEKIARNWKQTVHEEDLVLVPGDICWAMSIQEAQIDLGWIDDLPGRKLMLKGNHDYWWSSLSKVKSILPDSIEVLQNDAFHIQDISIAGARLWDSSEYTFESYIEYRPNPKEKKDIDAQIQKDLNEKLFTRELERLQRSLQKIDPKAKYKLAMTHYPPISADLQDSKVSKLLEKYEIQKCVFGHLHSLKQGSQLFGVKNNIEYIFVAADYVGFTPVRIL